MDKKWNFSIFLRSNYVLTEFKPKIYLDISVNNYFTRLKIIIYLKNVRSLFTGLERNSEITSCCVILREIALKLRKGDCIFFLEKIVIKKSFTLRIIDESMF